jgi:hypothetical protein
VSNHWAADDEAVRAWGENLIQLTLDAVQRETGLAIELVDEHAPPEWRDEAFVFVTRYLESHEFMFVDDLWDAGLPAPPEGRALGAVFQRAVRAGLMVKSGQFRPSIRSHLTEKPVWRSLIRNPTQGESE